MKSHIPQQTPTAGSTNTTTASAPVRRWGSPGHIQQPHSIHSIPQAPRDLQQQQQQHSSKSAKEDWRCVSPAANVEREFLAQHIEVMLRNKRPNAPQAMLQRLHSLARRLEQILYSQARSKAEYSNRFTLDQRIQTAVQRTTSTKPTTARGARISTIDVAATSSATGAMGAPRPQQARRHQRHNSNNNINNVQLNKATHRTPSATPSFKSSSSSSTSIPASTRPILSIAGHSAHHKYRHHHHHHHDALFNDVRMGKRRRASSSMSDGESSSGRGQRKRAMAFHCQYEIPTRSLNSNFSSSIGMSPSSHASSPTGSSSSASSGNGNTGTNSRSGTVVFRFSASAEDNNGSSSSSSAEEEEDCHNNSRGSELSGGGTSDSDSHGDDDDDVSGGGRGVGRVWNNRDSNLSSYNNKNKNRNKNSARKGRRNTQSGNVGFQNRQHQHQQHRGGGGTIGGVRRRRHNPEVTRCYQILDLLFAQSEHIIERDGDGDDTDSSGQHEVSSRRDLMRELHIMHSRGNAKLHGKMGEAIAYAITQHAIDVTHAQSNAPFYNNNSNSVSHAVTPSASHASSSSSPPPFSVSSPPAAPGAGALDSSAASAHVQAALTHIPPMDLSRGYSDDDDTDSDIEDTETRSTHTSPRVSPSSSLSSASSSVAQSPQSPPLQARQVLSTAPRVSIRKLGGHAGAAHPSINTNVGNGSNGFANVPVVDDFVPKVRPDDIEARFPNSYHSAHSPTAAASVASAASASSSSNTNDSDDVDVTVGGGGSKSGQGNEGVLAPVAQTMTTTPDDNSAEPLSLLLNFCGERFTRRPIPLRLMYTILLLFRPPPPENELKGIDPPPFDMRCLRRCVDRFTLAEPACASLVTARLLRSWPEFDSGYQILYLRQLESLFRLSDSVTGAALISPVIRRLARCALHGNCHVAMTAITLADKFLGFAQQLPFGALGSTNATSEARHGFVLLQRLLKTNQAHWNKTVVQASAALSQKLRTALCSHVSQHMETEW